MNPNTKIDNIVFGLFTFFLLFGMIISYFRIKILMIVFVIGWVLGYLYYRYTHRAKKK